MKNPLLMCVENKQIKINLPKIRSGDDVKVSVVITEGKKERIQIFEGKVIKLQGSGVNQTITVRKNTLQVGVERTFPIHSPIVAKIEVMGHSKVRRARLYFLRNLTGKKARLNRLKIK